MSRQDDINRQLESDQPVVGQSLQEKAVDTQDNKIRPVDDDYEPDVRKSNHYGEARVIDNANDLLTHVLHLENDPTESPWTFRAMLIGIVMCAFASVLQSIFYFKPQIIYVSVVFLTVISYVLALPFSFIPQPAGNGIIARICHFLNPWAFNSKEHTFAVIMGTAGSTTALATQALAAQRLYYGSNPNRAAAIFLVISSQFLSYGVAGLLRSTLVHPAKMLWPVNIPVNTLLEAFHHGKGETRQRLRYFTNVFSAAFLWELIPSWIAPIFQGVSIPCLINRDSLIVTNLFGGVQNNEGLGIFGLCFDWNYIAGMNSPLWYPISTLTNNFIGYLLCICIFTGVYYGNVWDSLKFPFLSQLLFDGSSNATNFVPYNITAVLNKDNTINDTLVTQQGIPYLTGSYMINLISVNMSITAAIIHLLLWNFDDIKAGWSFLRPSALKKLAYTNTYRFWKTKDQDELERANILADPEVDPHYKLMIQDGYTEVPHWWYVSVLVISFVVGMVTIYGIKSTLPWWSFIVSNLIAAVFILFFGAQMGLTGFQIDLQPMIQMLAGYLTPGRPLANMYFSAFGANGIQQGQWLLRDLKLAQLSHLSPKATFTAQMLGTIIGAIFNYIMMVSIVNSQWDALLSISGTNIWSGQNIQGYNTLAIAWSMAKHTFSAGSRYQWATLSYLVGFLAPIPFYIAYKLTRWKWLKAANASIIIYNTSLLCVGVNSSLLMFFGCGFFSQFYLRRYRPALFVKFNYLISAALDGGTQVMLFVLSFAVLGASGPAHDFPTYALNNGGSSANKNIDFCKYNAASADF